MKAIHQFLIIIFVITVPVYYARKVLSLPTVDAWLTTACVISQTLYGPYVMDTHQAFSPTETLCLGTSMFWGGGRNLESI